MRTALLLLAVAGCGGGSTSSQDMAMADLAMLPPADLATSPDMTRTISITVRIQDFTSQKPVAAVKVCVLPDTMNCASSDAAGVATVKAPEKSEIALTIDGSPAHDRVLTTFHTGTASFNIGFMIGTLAEDSARAAGFYTISDTAGELHIQTGTSMAALAGVSVALVPPTGKGPFYWDAMMNFDKNLTATTDTGFAAFGELPAGDYEVEVTAPMGMTCTQHPVIGWAGTKPTRIKVPIQNGFTTIGGFLCQ